MRRLRPGCLEKRTSAPKAVKRAGFYGTAEAMPFVKSLFPICLKPSPTLPCPSFDSLSSLLGEGSMCCPDWSTAVTHSRLYMSVDVEPETAVERSDQIRDSF